MGHATISQILGSQVHPHPPAAGATKAIREQGTWLLQSKKRCITIDGWLHTDTPSAARCGTEVLMTSFRFAFFLIRLSLSHRSLSAWGKIAMMGHGWSAQRRLHFEKGKRERENQSSAKLLFTSER